jgi:hypothetical protein
LGERRERFCSDLAGLVMIRLYPTPDSGSQREEQAELG